MTVKLTGRREKVKEEYKLGEANILFGNTPKTTTLYVDYERESIRTEQEKIRETFRFRSNKYFFGNHSYGGVVRKDTEEDGSINRVHHCSDNEGSSGRPINTDGWEEAILNAVKELPAHVRDVVEL